MIVAVDVHYTDSSATAGAVIFKNFTDEKPFRSVTLNVPEVDDYVSGQFFRRELPCILAILDVMNEDIEIIIIDGYVDLDEVGREEEKERGGEGEKGRKGEEEKDRKQEEEKGRKGEGEKERKREEEEGKKPGLGRHLYEALDRETIVIGVAKTLYKSVAAVEVRRGRSEIPLYVTAAGISAGDAAELIFSMYGNDRIPFLLKEADRMARKLDG